MKLLGFSFEAGVAPPLLDDLECDSRCSVMLAVSDWPSGWQNT